MDKSKDRISVVIPFYKGKSWLEDALETVLKQTVYPYEIIVINDGSTENITDLTVKYRNKVKFIYQENRGAASARNHGINVATGEYIAFLDSDDMWRENKLEVQLKYMKENRVEWSHCPYEVFEDGTYKIIGKIDNSDLDGMIFPVSLARCNIGTPCVMIKRAILEDTRMRFNEEMRQGQDYCFWNLLAKKYNIGNVGQSLVLVRNHGANKAMDVVAHIKTKSMMYDYIKKNFSYFEEIPFLLNVSFCLSKHGYNIVKRIKHTRMRKGIAYLLYTIPWMLFHIYYFLEKRLS